MKKRLLITGTAGFIGSNFIRKAIHEKQPYEFYSIDKITNSTYLHNIYNNKSHETFLADITDSHIIDKIVEYVNPDILINFAAESSVDKSINDPNLFIKTNIFGTQNLINSVLKFNKDCLFVQISTDEVYGSLKSENDELWAENSPLQPRNPYSASKASAEHIVMSSHYAYDLRYIITRSSNNYGPRQTANKLIPRVIKCVLNNQKIPIYSRGEHIRDWTNVFDNCSAILKILDSGKSNEVYNISSNQEFTNLEVVNEICNIMNKGWDLIEFVNDPRKNSHDFRYGVNSSKLRSLGWKPEYNFKKNGLSSCVNWYINNLYWFK